MTTALTIYVLIWPILVALTLIVLCTAVIRDFRRARRLGKRLV